MPNPRKYGKVGLFPGARVDRKTRAKINAAISASMKGKNADVPGIFAHCIQCRRSLNAAAIKRFGYCDRAFILPEACCQFCGRWPIDQALIEKGHLGVQSDPQWAVERLKIADLRTSFAPGDKVIPSQREAASV